MRILTLFILLFIVISPTQSHGLSCLEPHLEMHLNAEKIFIGRIIKIEKVEDSIHINKLHATVDEPIRNTVKNEELTLYQHHWINSVNEWEESTENVRKGIFALSLTENNDAELQNIDNKIYYIDMCATPYFEITEENLSKLTEIQ